MKGKISAALCNLFGVLILLTVIASCLPVTLPSLLGYEMYNISSGSMEPQLPVGSLIYVKPVAPEELSEGEIITFWRGDSVVTHRLMENRSLEGDFVTKGDANQEEDLNTVPYANLIGVVTYHIPYLGQMLVVYTSTVGKIYVICFAACGAMLNVLAGRIRDRAKERQEEEEAVYGKKV